MITIFEHIALIYKRTIIRRYDKQ